MVEIENTFLEWLKSLSPTKKTKGILQLLAEFREKKMKGWEYRGHLTLPRVLKLPQEDSEYHYRYIDTGLVAATTNIKIIDIYRRRKKKKYSK